MEVLYDNLENYDDTTAFEELKKENIELKLRLEENVIAMHKLQKEFDVLGQEFKNMQTNYSSLLKTAREEIKRKTDQITLLNQEKDAMVLKSIQNGTNIGRNFQGYNPRSWNRSSNREDSKNSKLGKDGRKGEIEPKTERYDNSGAQTKATPSNISSNNGSSRTNTHSSNPLKIAENDCNDRPKGPVNECKETPKPRSIRDRRKSMPAFESMTDENLRYDPPDRQHERFINRNNFKSSETSNVDRNYINHDPRTSNVNRHYETDRGRDKYDVSNRHRSRFSPEKYRRPDKEHMEDYHRPEPTRHRDHPPDTSTRYQHRNHDNRLSNDSAKHKIDERIASKHKMSSGYEESQAKRQRIEHTDKHTKFDDRRNKCSDKIMKQSILNPELLEPGEIYDSCQSPDIMNQDGTSNFTIREIKLDPVEKLPDPRKVSNKYASKTGNGAALTSISSGDIRMKPINKSSWQGSKVEVKVPDALKHNPFQLSEGLGKEIHMDIKKRGHISPETDNDSTLNDRTVSHHMKDKFASQADDIGREKAQKCSDIVKLDKEPQSKRLETRKSSLDNKAKVCELVLQTNAKENKNLKSNKKVPEGSVKPKNVTKSEVKETKMVSENKTNAIEEDLHLTDITKIKKSPKDCKILEGDSDKSKNLAKSELRGTKHNSDSKKNLQTKNVLHTEVKKNKKPYIESKVEGDPEIELNKHKKVPKVEKAESKNVSMDNNKEEKVNTAIDKIKTEKSSKTKHNIEPIKDIITTPTEELESMKKRTTKNSHRTTKPKSYNKTSPIEKPSTSNIPNASLPVIATDCSDNTLNCNEKNSAKKLDIVGCVTNKRHNDDLDGSKLSKSNIALVENDLELSDDTSDHKELSVVPKSKRRTKSISKSDTKISEKCDSNKNTKDVKTANKDEGKDVIDSNKTHNKKRKDSEQDTKETVKDLSKMDKKSKSKTKNDCKSLDTKNKLSELFGESSSLITPEDLGIPLYGPPPDDAQDAVDIDIRQCMKLQPDNDTVENDANNTVLPNCIQDKHTVDKPPNTVDSNEITYSAKNSFKSVPEIITSDTNDILNIVYENLDSESKTNDKDVVKTVIISTGIQPQLLIEDNKPIQIKNEPKPLINHFELNALATSTPYKGVIETKSDETASNEHSTSEVQNDAPDVRIFVKRRKRALKKAPNS